MAFLAVAANLDLDDVDLGKALLAVGGEVTFIRYQKQVVLAQVGAVHALLAGEVYALHEPMPELPHKNSDVGLPVLVGHASLAFVARQQPGALQKVKHSADVSRHVIPSAFFVELFVFDELVK